MVWNRELKKVEKQSSPALSLVSFPQIHAHMHTYNYTHTHTHTHTHIDGCSKNLQQKQ